MQKMKWCKIWDSHIGPKIEHFPKNSKFSQSVQLFQTQKWDPLGTLWGHALYSAY